MIDGRGDDVVIGGDAGNAVYLGPGQDRVYLGAGGAGGHDRAVINDMWRHGNRQAAEPLFTRPGR